MITVGDGRTIVPSQLVLCDKQVVLCWRNIGIAGTFFELATQLASLRWLTLSTLAIGVRTHNIVVVSRLLVSEQLRPSRVQEQARHYYCRVVLLCRRVWVYFFYPTTAKLRRRLCYDYVKMCTGINVFKLNVRRSVVVKSFRLTDSIVYIRGSVGGDTHEQKVVFLVSVMT